MWKLRKAAEPKKLGEHRVFIAARHGDHDASHYNLTEKGMRQVRELATAVGKVAAKRGLIVEIMSSTEPCALKSARMIASILLADYHAVAIQHDCFLEEGAGGDHDLAVKTIETFFRDGVLLLLVSNSLGAHRLVRYVAGLVGFDAKRREIEHGQGLMVARKGVSIIPRPPRQG